jgi:hypothetical protein
MVMEEEGEEGEREERRGRTGRETEVRMEGEEERARKKTQDRIGTQGRAKKLPRKKGHTYSPNFKCAAAKLSWYVGSSGSMLCAAS